MSTCDIQHDSPACGATRHADGTVRWCVWAPFCETVQLVLFDEQGNSDEVAMDREPGTGYFVHEAAGVGEGQRYAYRLSSGLVRPDPASRWQPDGVHRPSAVMAPHQFRWKDEHWSGVARDDLVIYELHVGTFSPAGTFDAIIPRLGALRELGVTAIELMPVAQFPGVRGWGYDGVHPFAVQNSYGGPHGLQRLIDICHQAGLAVIVDVVYNHLGPEGNYLAEFGPYFTDRYHTPWGTAINFDQSGCDGVRAFVLENVRHWVRDFHVDGLRLDAVQTIFDSSSPHILKQIKEAAQEEADQLGWPVHVIAESNQNDVHHLNLPGRGHGLDAVWSDDFHHSVHALLTGERQGYYMDYGRLEHLVKALNHTFVYDGCHSAYRGRCYGTHAENRPGDRFVVCLQNHDQVGNRSQGDRFGTLLDPTRQRLAAGLLLLAPFVPLIFMGEEYGETRPFPFFCSFSDSRLAAAVWRGRREECSKLGMSDEVPDPQSEATFQSAQLGWSWADSAASRGLRDLYRDLLKARRDWPALRDVWQRNASLIGTGSAPQVLRLVRGGHSPGGEQTLVADFNLSHVTQPLRESVRQGSKLLLSSENVRYHGSRTLATPSDVLLPFEFLVRGPTSWESP